MNRFFLTLLAFFALSLTAAAQTDKMSNDFQNLPHSTWEMTGPLFWLHGTESREQLESMVDRVAESGNGMLTAESRPHNDWLGETWYRDLAIVIERAKKHDLKVYIFDDYWWPSQMMGGRVPNEMGCKRVCAQEFGPNDEIPFDAPNLITVAAARRVAPGTFDAASVQKIDSSWKAPADGDWRVLVFTWEYVGKHAFQKRMISVNGLDSACVDWFLETVYKPHYDRFQADFGKTVPGFFYDEPETNGDWGPDLETYLAQQKLPLETLLTAHKFQLEGEAQNTARFEFLDARAEVWGKTMYGKTTEWCREHNVLSTGHFMEHSGDFYNQGLSAGNMMQLAKYTELPGIDLVCRQFYPGGRNMAFYQMPKISSSLAHVYNMSDGVNMCEIFGAYGQDITYPQMKWLCDWHQVRGCNMLIPHSFNPRAPFDRDCPPYFYNGGREPRYPLYRVWANYTNRLASVLSHGTHIAPIAQVVPGQSFHCGKTMRPEMVTSTLQDIQMDCDWILYDALTSAVLQTNPRTKRPSLKIANEFYDILLLPATDIIPYEILVKAKEFLAKGGIVMGYGVKPTYSATWGKDSSEIQSLFHDIFETENPRACFLENDNDPAVWAEAFARLGVAPAVQLADGSGVNIHVYQYAKDGKDIYYLCNQNWNQPARELRLTIANAGNPEVWDAMQGTITRPTFERNAQTGACELTLKLNAAESAVLVFHPEARPLPARVEAPAQCAVQKIPLTLEGREVPSPAVEVGTFAGASWIWEKTQQKLKSDIFLKTSWDIPANDKVVSAEFTATCDNGFELSLNGQTVMPMTTEIDLWRSPRQQDLAASLKSGQNELLVKGSNFLPGDAGFIAVWKIELASGRVIQGSTQAEDWLASVDGKTWAPAFTIGQFGCGPWGHLGAGAYTASPIAHAVTGHAAFTLPALKPGQRVFAAFGNIAPEDALRLHVNDTDAGGFIGAPHHLDITSFVKPGANTIRTEPFLPESAEILIVE